MENLLSVSPVLGGICLLLLLIGCFLAVHILRLARIGWKARKPKKEEPAPKPKEPPRREEPAPTPPPAPEPVYYIVERKKRRVKSEYTPPKEIKFK